MVICFIQWSGVSITVIQLDRLLSVLFCLIQFDSVSCGLLVSSWCISLPALFLPTMTLWHKVQIMYPSYPSNSPDSRSLAVLFHPKILPYLLSSYFLSPQNQEQCSIAVTRSFFGILWHILTPAQIDKLFWQLSLTFWTTFLARAIESFHLLDFLAAASVEVSPQASVVSAAYIQSLHLHWS